MENDPAYWNSIDEAFPNTKSTLIVVYDQSDELLKMIFREEAYFDGKAVPPNTPVPLEPALAAKIKYFCHKEKCKRYARYTSNGTNRCKGLGVKCKDSDPIEEC